VRRRPHENVATALVDACALPDLELELMTLDLWVWPVATAPICVDGARAAFQLRRQMLARERGGWQLAESWTPVWISFGPTWRTADEPLPWAAHKVLWQALDAHAEHVRFKRRLGGVRPLRVPADLPH
jgi:hypothetical protein